MEKAESPEPAATLLRMAPSHIRFGNFEALAVTGREDLVKVLADYVIASHFPQFEGRFPAWLREVTVRTARLVASWQAVGFAHGVLNTDNMSILGLTLDYGPYAFMEECDPGFTPTTPTPRVATPSTSSRRSGSGTSPGWPRRSPP